jgi:hypothetical protein
LVLAPTLKTHGLCQMPRLSLQSPQVSPESREGAELASLTNEHASEMGCSL